jgi:predicted MFS family arabinose efflux permease
VVGNFVAGRWARRGVRGTSAVAAGLIAVATALLPVVGRCDVGALALLVVWGLGYGAVPVCSQTWFAGAVPHAPEAAAVVLTSSFQATLSFGALVVDAASPSTVMVLGGAVAALVVVVAGRSCRHAVEVR